VPTCPLPICPVHGVPVVELRPPAHRRRGCGPVPLRCEAPVGGGRVRGRCGAQVGAAGSAASGVGRGWPITVRTVGRHRVVPPHRIPHHHPLVIPTTKVFSCPASVPRCRDVPVAANRR